MTREEKIWELVDKYWKEDEMCRSDLFDFAKEIIAIDEWISVEDEPTLYKNYLCTVHNEPPVVSSFNGECWTDRNGDEVFNIIKYRPLPTPPKGEQT